MHSADAEVLRHALTWLESGQDAWLCTVLHTWGSAPRAPGALLALCADGRAWGSVSGGCVEDDLARRLASAPDEHVAPLSVEYGISADEAERFGLPCGGRIGVLMEPLKDPGALRSLLAAIESRRLLARTLEPATGAVSLAAARPGDPLLRQDAQRITRVFGPLWRLLLIGANQLTGYVASMARTLEYEVLVCDPRDGYARSWEDTQSPLLTLMPDDAVREHAGDARCAVIALTHDPRLDDMALMEALDSAAFYVGALGSRRNSDRRRERLAQLGLSAQALARLRGPVGLPIGSHTPAEIAVSILAELTAVRNGRDGASDAAPA